MFTTTVACPQCGKSLKITQALPAGTKVRCTACGQPFPLPGNAPLAVTAAAPAPPPAPAGGRFLPQAPTAVAAPLSPSRPAPTRGGGFLRGLLVFAVLLGVASVGLGLYFKHNREKADEGKVAANDKKGGDDKDTHDGTGTEDSKGRPSKADGKKEEKKSTSAQPDGAARDRKPAEKNAPAETVVRPSDYDPTPRPRPDPVVRPQPPVKPDPMPKPPDPVVKKDPPVKPDPMPKPPDPMVKKDPPPDRGLPAELQGQVNRAIDRGVDKLRATQGADGAFPGQEGMTALVGVTLLECRVPPDDAAIRRAADYVRAEVLRSDRVYALSTAVIFLDRLGDPVDVPLLEALTVRLLSGQNESGGWAYTTAPVPEDEVKRLTAYYQGAAEHKPDAPKKPRTIADLAPETRQRLTQLRPMPAAKFGPGDHSNTQFASLALWIGRRQGVPVDAALAGVDRRFRTSQNQDGGWGYIMGGSTEAQTTHTMTCSGILCLALAHGARPAKKPNEGEDRVAVDLARDPGLRKALNRLSLFIGPPPSVTKTPPPVLVKRDYYFLWSLERVLVLMNLERLGGKDWYRWGSEILVANQHADGSWAGDYGEADTCFALLFLHKANLVKDLEVRINKQDLIDEDRPKK